MKRSTDLRFLVWDIVDSTDDDLKPQDCLLNLTGLRFSFLGFLVRADFIESSKDSRVSERQPSFHKADRIAGNFKMLVAKKSDS